MSILRIPEFPQEPPYFVYGILASDKTGGYVKFGISKNIGTRLSGIRTSCPIPIRYITVVDADYKEKALATERALHKHFDNRKIQGEWFRFDFTSEQDKKEFNTGCQQVFVNKLGPGHWWTKVSIAALDKYEKERRLNLINSDHYRKIQRRYAEMDRVKRAWKELSAGR